MLWRFLPGLLCLGPLCIAGDTPSAHTDDAEQPPEKVSFNATDGHFVHAAYYGPLSSYNPAPIVILVHDCPGERGGWAPLVAPLREAGFAVLALDLRGFGESATSETRSRAGQNDPKLLADMQKDVRGAYDWLAQQAGVDRARVALVAAGLGASVALRYASKDRSVDAVVCLSPRLTSPGLDPLGDMGQIHGRTVLLIGGKGDQAACRALAARGEHARVEIVPAAGSGVELLGDTPELRRRVANALIQAVGPPSDRIVYGSIESNVYHAADSGWIARINPSNLRYYSSPEEAESRGLRAAKSRGPGDSARDTEARQQP